MSTQHPSYKVVHLSSLFIFRKGSNGTASIEASPFNHVIVSTIITPLWRGGRGGNRMDGWVVIVVFWMPMSCYSYQVWLQRSQVRCTYVHTKYCYKCSCPHLKVDSQGDHSDATTTTIAYYYYYYSLPISLAFWMSGLLGAPFHFNILLNKYLINYFIWIFCTPCSNIYSLFFFFLFNFSFLIFPSCCCHCINSLHPLYLSYATMGP